MPDVIYDGPFEGVQSSTGVVFPKGEPVTVDAEIAESLLSQDFTITDEMDDE